jgi:hypothetical protein
MGAPAAERRPWYALDVPAADARFVFLDSNGLQNVRKAYPAAIAAEQLAWADSVLAGPARYKFVVFHHPLISGGHYRDPWDGRHPESAVAKRRARLLEMFARHGVTAVLAGHEHMFQRVCVRSTDGGGVWHVTCAGGGAPLYVLDHKARDVELAKPLPPGLTVDTGSVFGRSVYSFSRLVLPRADAPEAHAMLTTYHVHSGGRITPLDRVDLARPPGAP